MKKNTKIALGAAGGVVAAGAGYLLYRKISDSAPINMHPDEFLGDPPPDDDVYSPDESVPITQVPTPAQQLAVLSPVVASTASQMGTFFVPTSPPAQGMASLVPMGTIKAKILKPKYYFKYTAGDWPSGGTLHSTYSTPKTLTFDQMMRFQCAWGGWLGANTGIVVTSVPKFVNYMLQTNTMGNAPPGLKKYADTGKNTVEISVPAGTYYVSPVLSSPKTRSTKLLDRYFKWTKAGPLMFNSGEVLDKAKTGNCSNEWAKIYATQSPALMTSSAPITVPAGASISIEIQPVYIFRIGHPDFYSNADSNFWKILCEGVGWTSGMIPDGMASELWSFYTGLTQYAPDDQQCD